MAASSNPNTATSQSQIFQQIEQTSGYFSPGLYQSLLTVFNSIELTTDEVASQFIPVSDALLNPDQNKKLFIIGVVPPSSNVTGNTLDRSNSIAGPIPSTPEPLTPTDTRTVQSTAISNGGGYGYNGQVTDGVKGSNQGPAQVVPLSQQQMGVAIRDAYQQRFGQPPSQNTLSMLVGQSIRENSGNWPNYNPGNIGNFNPNTTGGQNNINKNQTFSYVNKDGSVSYYMSYPTAQAGANAFVGAIANCGGPAALSAANSGDVQAYCQALHDGGYYTDTVNDYVAHFPNVQAIAGNLGDPNSLNAPTPPVLALGPKTQVDSTDPGTWQSQGSSASNQSTQMLSANAANNQVDNTTNTALLYTAQQKSLISQTQRLIKQMAQTPPLKFIVNPQSFKVAAEHIISTGGWTRYGPSDVVEHWGEQQDKIDASGKVAAFQAVDLTTDTGGPGLTRTARQYSAAYQNFLSLYLLYKNNAGIYMTDNVEPTDTARQILSVLGSIYIYYDHTLYFGSFDNFTVTETDTAPYTIEYSFNFTVRASFLLDQVSDPNFTYAISQQGGLVQSPPVIPTSQSATLSAGQPQSAAQVAANTAYTNATANGATSQQAQAAAVDAGANTLVNNGVDFNTANGAALAASLGI